MPGLAAAMHSGNLTTRPNHSIIGTIMEESAQIPHDLTVSIPVEGEVLSASLAIPEQARGVVLFSHGSGSSRFSPRNRYVAEFLQQLKMATVLLDLLTPKEENQDLRTGQWRFDIDLLGTRLVQAADWLQQDGRTTGLPLGLFGASTGAAAALVAAAERPQSIAAIVSRGGRPDLAGTALAHVKAPTLLIVGGQDLAVLDLNRSALQHLNGEKRLEIIPGATHLFEEPGALLQVARLAGQWFDEHLVRPGAIEAA